MALAYPTLVFVEGDIKHPMQTVLDFPVTPRRLSEGFGRIDASTADVENLLTGDLACDVTFSFDPPDPGHFYFALTHFNLLPFRQKNPEYPIPRALLTAAR
jgi:hypothetical protein